MFPKSLLLAALCLSWCNAQTFAELSARASDARLANRLDEAVKLYRAALDLNPKWQEGWWFLGSILYDTNGYAGCRDALRKLVDLKQDASPAWGILGLCEFQTADYASSLEHVQRALAAPPAEPDMEKVLRFHEAMLLTRTGDFDRAIQKFVWFLRGGPPKGVLLTALGLAALRTPLVPQEIPADRQDLFAAAGIAAFSQMTGDRAGAQQNFQALLDRYPTAQHVHYLYACSLLASEPEAAIREFRRELEITPGSSGTLAMLAWALLNRGDAAAALPYAEKAVRIEPGYPLAQYVAGRSLAETGRPERGIEYLERASKMDPANLEVHLALAAAYPKVRRFEDARRERKKALELTGEAGSVASR